MSKESQPYTNGVPKKQLVNTTYAKLELKSPRRDVYNARARTRTHARAREIQDRQRLNKYQEPAAKLNSKAHCYQLGEECFFNRDILKALRRTLWACREPGTLETGTTKTLSWALGLSQKQALSELLWVQHKFHMAPTLELPSHIWCCRFFT